MSNLLGLRKFVSPEIIFGNDARLLTGKYAKQFGGRKVLIVTDPGVIKAGWLVDIQKSLEDVDLPYEIFSDISPNPRAAQVDRGADMFTETGCNLIVTIGGGSPMDCAKAIGIVISNKKSIYNFEGVDKIKNPIPPLICIPTTAGSSADVSQFCIITNRDERVKMAIVSKSVVPDVSLIDPITTRTMSRYLTACTGIDALVHAVEAYVSTASGPLTDDYALEAIRLIFKYLPTLHNNPDNKELREQIMLASMKAGLAFSNAILGAVHAMAHSLGGYLDLAHGECNALLLEHVVDFNFDYAAEKYINIAKIIGVSIDGLSNKDIKDVLVKKIIQLKKSVDITGALAERGVKTTDIKKLSEKAVKDACMVTNPREAKLDDVISIYKEAL